jgi:hypothetical protein
MNVLVLTVVLAFLSIANAVLVPKMGVVSNYELLKTGKFGSRLMQMNGISGSTYGEYNPYILDLTSDPFEAGYDAGMLFGKEYAANIKAIFDTALDAEGKWWESAARNIIYHFLDKQFKFLSEQLPEEYKKEFEGLSAGGASIGLTGFENDVGLNAQRGLVLGNFPSDADHLKLIIKDEKEHEIANGGKWDHLLEKEILLWIEKKEGKGKLGFGCSNWGAWGARTSNQDLFSGRNLDWMRDTGVTKYKLITIHHPVNGIAHADIGVAGIWGSLTGMSADGITVHEANLESDDITFYGFPWLLRVRHIMAYSNDLDSGIALWKATNNTVGFNHGIGSSKDGKMMLFETMAHNTAFFGAMDPRESASETGNPRSDAVYRTNHGYDPYTVEHYAWNTDGGAYKNSLWRYNLFPVLFDQYDNEKQLIGPLQAANISAIVGHKGKDNDEDTYNCNAPYPNGENVLSVAFHPKELKAYVSWESGTGDAWIPAACNTYVEVDLKEFF